MRSLGRQYAPYLWLRFVSTAAMGALPILVILAYIAVLKRKRRLIREYEQEEWEESQPARLGEQPAAWGNAVASFSPKALPDGIPGFCYALFSGLGPESLLPPSGSIP